MTTHHRSTRTRTRTRTRIAPLPLALALIAALAATYALANVRTIAKVHAGDVVELAGGWMTRVTGVRCPDLDGPVGRQAAAFTRRHLEGQRVRMFTLTTDHTAAGIVFDDDGMPMAEFRFGYALELDLGAELLRRGLAHVDYNHLPEDLLHYRDIEEEARRNGLGMWSRSI